MRTAGPSPVALERLVEHIAAREDLGHGVPYQLADLFEAVEWRMDEDRDISGTRACGAAS